MKTNKRMFSLCLYGFPRSFLPPSKNVPITGYSKIALQGVSLHPAFPAKH